MEEEKAAESFLCHITKRMHCPALENVKGGKKTLRFSWWSFSSIFFYGRNNHIH